MAKGQKSITVQEKLYRKIQRYIRRSTFNSVAEFTKHWLRIGLDKEKRKEN